MLERNDKPSSHFDSRDMLITVNHIVMLRSKFKHNICKAHTIITQLSHTQYA